MMMLIIIKDVRVGIVAFLLICILIAGLLIELTFEAQIIVLICYRCVIAANHDATSSYDIVNSALLSLISMILLCMRWILLIWLLLMVLGNHTVISAFLSLRVYWNWLLA